MGRRKEGSANNEGATDGRTDGRTAFKDEKKTTKNDVGARALGRVEWGTGREEEGSKTSRWTARATQPSVQSMPHIPCALLANN